MACQKKEEGLTFLYQFAKGECARSFGIDVAAMAGLPDSVVRLARKKTAQFDREVDYLRKKKKKSMAKD